MITRGIREFMARDWEAIRELKDRHWAERIQRLGAVEGLRIADDLRRQVMAQQPGWPGEAERRADLEAHVRLSQLFRRADRASRDSEPGDSMRRRTCDE